MSAVPAVGRRWHGHIVPAVASVVVAHVVEVCAGGVVGRRLVSVARRQAMGAEARLAAAGITSHSLAAPASTIMAPSAIEAIEAILPVFGTKDMLNLEKRH